MDVIRTEYGAVHGYRRSGESKTKGTTDSPNRKVSSKTESLRIVLNLLGDGYVEAIQDTTLMAIASQQRVASNGQIHGTYSRVTLPEKRNGKKAIGRFWWKGQHGSILSAAADAPAN